MRIKDDGQFSAAVRQLRLGLDMTMQQLADEIGVDRGTISRLENQLLNPEMRIQGRLVQLAMRSNMPALAHVFLKPFSSVLGTTVPALERAVNEEAA